MKKDITLRKAIPRDAAQIVDLYQSVYQGDYSDPMMSETARLRAALGRDDYYWIVASIDDRIVGSVVYQHTLTGFAKVFGAVIENDCRGQNLTERMMEFGYAQLRAIAHVEVVYATTRTVSSAPQKLTANLGYRKLGIFPNVHKTSGYETHCLTALFTKSAFASRFTDFALHPRLRPLFEIVRRECGLPAIPDDWIPHTSAENFSRARSALELELIHAPRLTKRRFDEGKNTLVAQEHHTFFPFQEPNLLISSADQDVEVFCYFSETDKHCVLIAIHDLCNAGFADIVEKASVILQDLGVRYIEFIIRADESEKIEIAMQAGFIPCAYFPAMHLIGAQRYDFVIFSRSYEILNFRNIRLEGINHEYLNQYLQLWKKNSLEPEPACAA
ncbi:hypothetical protein PO883_11645 [Massilia sp. DJPM01]|uniref:GNAT family N-acetyltransferase n=1 Tax=Massilia sp. DJPM01 TaxID=3024404 RepID=UPI00259E2971|nr:GNAT family N-acetyltransferase [Massilia sp. DJPM01]MDM5177845.1 hypothetical protein [Massilia sp. DJPM01]